MDHFVHYRGRRDGGELRERHQMEPVRESVRRAYRVCPVEVSVAVLGGSWKMTIVKQLLDGPMRYGALGRAVGPVTPRVLTRQLRELETDGIVQRTAYPEVPPRVEYSLTQLGHALEPFVATLNAWGKQYAAEVLLSPQNLHTDVPDDIS